jgi:hypothetical protein
MTYPEGFERFWSRVWRKDAKHAAHKEWAKMDDADKKLAEEVVDQHFAYYAERELSYRPHVRTWLHQRRYEDELVDPCAGIQEDLAQQKAWEQMGWGGMVHS